MQPLRYQQRINGGTPASSTIPTPVTTTSVTPEPRMTPIPPPSSERPSAEQHHHGRRLAREGASPTASSASSPEVQARLFRRLEHANTPAQRTEVLNQLRPAMDQIDQRMKYPGSHPPSVEEMRSLNRYQSALRQSGNLNQSDPTNPTQARAISERLNNGLTQSQDRLHTAMRQYREEHRAQIQGEHPPLSMRDRQGLQYAREVAQLGSDLGLPVQERVADVSHWRARLDAVHQHQPLNARERAGHHGDMVEVLQQAR